MSALNFENCGERVAAEKSSTGLLEWENKSDAIEAILTCNHTDLDNPSKATLLRCL